MTLRTAMVLLMVGTMVLLGVFLAVSGTLLWGYLAPILPGTLPLLGLTVPAHLVFFIFAGLFVVLLALVLTFFTLLFKRLIVSPLLALTAAIESFTQNQHLTSLPSASGIKELQDLTAGFIRFTNAVETVHARDTEISRVKSDFISTAAHQLRTPLTGIRWTLEALSKEPLTPEQLTLVKNAQDKSKDLVGVVGTLLDISSIESGKHTYVFEPVDLPALVQLTANDFETLAHERSVSITYRAPESIPAMVRADRQQISWILNNLIENGIRYTPAGGSVTIGFLTAPGRLQVYVSDTGIGIAQKDKGNIFERFYRAENAISKENGGNGLGLYIARTIATDHGGELSFTSNAGGPGTTFTLSLPLA